MWYPISPWMPCNYRGYFGCYCCNVLVIFAMFVFHLFYYFCILPSRSTIRHLQSTICHPICHLPSAIRHLPFVICHSSFAICHSSFAISYLPPQLPPAHVNCHQRLQLASCNNSKKTVITFGRSFKIPLSGVRQFVVVSGQTSKGGELCAFARVRPAHSGKDRRQKRSRVV